MTAPPRSTEVVAVNGLYALKPWYARRLGSIVDLAVARGVSPDVCSVTGPLGVWYQPFNGVPIKVYAAEAGRLGLDIGAFATWAGIERTARIVGVGVVLTLVADALHPSLRRFYGTYVVLATAGFLVLLGLTVDRWS